MIVTIKAKITSFYFILVKPTKLSHLPDTTTQASHNFRHSYFGSRSHSISYATDGLTTTVLDVGNGENRWIRVTFSKIYEVEFMVINGSNEKDTMYFEVGNSTIAGSNLLCNTRKKEQRKNAFRFVICGNRRMIGKYAVFYGDGDYYFREFQVYGWENV